MSIQADLPLLILLPFGWSIHWSFYLSSQPEAFYAIPITQMILSSSCHFALLKSSFLHHKELCSTREISPAVSSVSGWSLLPSTIQSVDWWHLLHCQSSTNLWCRVSICPYHWAKVFEAVYLVDCISAKEDLFFATMNHNTSFGWVYMETKGEAAFL